MAKMRDRLAILYAALGRPLPAWLTNELFTAAAALIGVLAGRWKATRFGPAMVAELVP